MTVETPTKTCPRCNSVITEDAPGGLCPRCLMQFVAMSTGGTDFPPEDRLPPDLETVRAAFPHLEILELIGQGGMGAVYKARQTKLDRIVALKILPLRLAREPLFAERFEREGRMLARLNHPNIVAVHDFGQADGLYYLMMEYVDGVNLRQALTSAHFTPQQALSVIPKICDALQFAHDEGVLHRDIKPENILLDTKGRVKIADFGIAKFSGADDKTGLTATGATIGTPHYMAPEQIERPSDVDHRADIFSLGVVFYEMLTGELPLGRFAAPSERTQALDTRIDHVVMRALEKDRDRRQQSANEVRTEVEFLSNSSANDQIARTKTTTTKSPILDLTSKLHRNRSRPTIAITLIVASIVVPLLVLLVFIRQPNRSVPIGTYLVMIAAWLGIPGTVFGVIHLQHLGRSGHRNGLWRAVVASTFWPFSIAMCFLMYLAIELLQSFHNGNASAVEPIEVTLVLVLGLVATVLSIRFVHRWMKRIPPENEVTGNVTKPNSSLRNVPQLIAGTLWIFFGLAIIFMAPVGTLERILLAWLLIGVAVLGARAIKRWIDGSSPASTLANISTHPVDTAIQNILKGFVVLVWIGILFFGIHLMSEGKTKTNLAQGSLSPTLNVGQEQDYLQLDIAGISTIENVLVIDVMDRAVSIAMEMKGLEDATGEETAAAIRDNVKFKFRIDFQGPKLSPEALLLASASYKENCLFPGEPSERIFDLSEEKTVTLAFAFPDAKTAQAFKFRIERQLHANGQLPGILIGEDTNPVSEKSLLFDLNNVYDAYRVFVESVR